jgi:hypothetical protein
LQARIGAKIETGTPAKIVVDDLSSVSGRLVYANGKPVTTFAVRLGRGQPHWFNAPDGKFEIRDVPAGKQYIQLSGLDFVAQPLVDVVVESKPTDLGTITVANGRTIAGTVLDKTGRAIAGATVILAREIKADGTSLTPYPDMAASLAVSGADGRFKIRGVGTGLQQIAADHEAAGRSKMTTIPPGTADTDLAITLVQPGVVQGFVRADGKPVEALIVLRPDGAADSRIGVRTGADGSYRLDRVAPDHYALIAVRLQGTRQERENGKATRLEVAAGKTVNHDIDLTVSGVNVAMHIGSPTVEFGYGVIAMTDDPAAQSWPMPKTMSEGRAYGAKLGSYSMREGMIVTNKQLNFEKVPPGKHVACIAPLRADPADPQVMAELQRNTADWPLYCKWFTVAAAPDQQHVTVDVQPYTPLSSNP